MSLLCMSTHHLLICAWVANFNIYTIITHLWHIVNGTMNEVFSEICHVIYIMK